MRRFLSALLVAAVLVFAFLGPAAAATSSATKAEVSAVKAELNAYKKLTNERIALLVERANTIEAHDNGQDPKIAALESAVAALGKGSGGQEPPVEEVPPVEEPPHEEPPVEPPPHEEPTGCSTTVSSLGAANSALAPGKTVCLADGTYGSATLTNGGTLTAAHTAAVTTGALKVDTDGLTIQGLKVNGEITVQPGSDHIWFVHNTISGGYMGIITCNSTTTPCADQHIVGNRFVGPFGEDAIRANRYEGLYVEGNEFTKVIENGNHSDCLQSVWTGNNIVFRKNYLHDNHCQGFFIKDQGGPGGSSACTGGNVCGPVNGITVDDNLFIRNHEPCVNAGCGPDVYLHIFGPYTGLKVTRNTIWGDGLDSQFAPRETAVPAGSLIEGNVIYRFWTDINASAATFQNNTFCRLEGTWPSSRPGSEVNCAESTPTPAGRGIDWDPAQQHYGP